eukprot:tig00001033_g6500.t1
MSGCILSSPPLLLRPSLSPVPLLTRAQWPREVKHQSASGLNRSIGGATSPCNPFTRTTHPPHPYPVEQADCIAPINYIKLGRAGSRQRREALALIPPGDRLLPAPGLPARTPRVHASDELIVRHELYEWAHLWALAHGAGHVLQVLRILHDSPVDGNRKVYGKDRVRPDFLIEFEHFVVVVEVDERGHGRTNVFARMSLSTAIRYRRSAEDARMREAKREREAARAEREAKEREREAKEREREAKEREREAAWTREDRNRRLAIMLK